MGKYNKYAVSRSKDDKQWEVHPVWRGIGCLLGILVPIMSYTGAALLVRENFQNNWFKVPEELAATVDFSQIYRFLPGLKTFFLNLGPIYYLEILLTFVFLVIGFGAISVLYSTMYSAVGPSRYGAYDSPPVGRASRSRMK
jgi:hypothetical protein